MVIRNDDERTVLDSFASEFDFCWACGVSVGMWKHESGGVVAKLDIHHMAKLCRKNGRWNLARLCRMCHDLAEGKCVKARVHTGGELVRLPRLAAENVMWLKGMFDSKNYERGKLQEYTARLLHRSVRPAGYFEIQFATRRNRYYDRPLFAPRSEWLEKRLAGALR